MSQNLCLICCYSFPTKRSRFISNDTRESLQKFCGEFGVRLNKNGAHGLNLPFGDNITVCGDCLSLVVLYVQGRAVQCQKEEKLIELQRAVCAALKDLQEVVEEVQEHIDELHSTMRMGDESTLDRLCKNIPDKENNPRLFRTKILKLNTGFIKAKRVIHKDGSEIPINIKVEPQQRDEEDDSSSFFNADDTSAFLERDQLAAKSPRPRRSRGTFKESPSDNDFDDDLPPCPEVASDSFLTFDSDSEASNSKCSSKTRKKRARKPSNIKLPKKLKTVSYTEPTSQEPQETPSQWKDSLVSRIIMQMNYDIHDDVDSTSQQQQTATSSDKNETSDASASSYSLDSTSYQFIDGKLNLRGIVVNIREDCRALQCTKCGKNFFEARDATGDTSLETLMRDHILWKHYVCQRSKTASSGSETIVPRRKTAWEILDISESEVKSKWRLRSTKCNTDRVTKTYYCPVRGKCCPAVIRKLEFKSGDIVYETNGKEHQHHGDGESRGLTLEQKEFVQEHLKRQISKPKDFLVLFRAQGVDEPSKRTLKNFLQYYRANEKQQSLEKGLKVHT